MLGFIFRKSFKIAPGVRLNVSKSGISVTIGPRGAKVTIGSKGTRVTTGIPGTGMSYTTKLNKNKLNAATQKTTRDPMALAKKITEFDDTHIDLSEIHVANIKQDAFYKKDWFIIIMLILLYPLGIFLMYNYSINLRKIRFVINVLPILVVSIAGKTLAGILGLLLPLIFVPIFAIACLYCLCKTKYFMPAAMSVIVSCVSFGIFAMRFIEQ